MTCSINISIIINIIFMLCASLEIGIQHMMPREIHPPTSACMGLPSQRDIMMMLYSSMVSMQRLPSALISALSALISWNT